MNYKKVYVEVLVRHEPNGNKIPVSILFEDGKSYMVDRVLDRRIASATKVGGTGIRYSVRIQGKETYLFEDDDKWYVEAKSI